ncbi:MAG: 4-hydroxythreonine-4-phosphate dehydrogenase PdxA [Bacteroidales bacterium]|jgi:4-hydroxythreonine-4-phosphate dehydrogenase|nr:4-hydroxythreonine-4-phosphate dehydrogenase PdxA [Bacteroidales bacterium]
MSETEKQITVGITHGDINGIGYEIITKVLSDPQMMEICTPVVFGSSKAASYHRKTIKGLSDFTFNVARQINQLSRKKPNMYNITDEELKIELGEVTPLAGKMSLKSLTTAVQYWISKKIDVLVTAPINKKNIDMENFTGHTEYLAAACNTTNYLMLMVADKLKIGTVTTHLPLSQVPEKITKDAVLGKLRILNESLIKDFCIVKPRIAVLALNPHAGEGGQFGKEEQKAIIPAIETAFNDGIYAFGPYAADGLFGSGEYLHFDAVLGMYHDQSMLPFKLLSNGEGVNYTAGLQYVRTSPAHGTAYDIAGKNSASPNSFRNAIYLACDIFKNRQNYALNSKPKND